MKITKAILFVLLITMMTLGCGTIATDGFIGTFAASEPITSIETEIPVGFETAVQIEPAVSTQDPEPVLIEALTPTEASEIEIDVHETEYHITVLAEEEAFALGVIPVYAEWLNIPVYARLNEAGTVDFYVFAHEHENGFAGFLPVEFSEPDEDMNVSIGIDTEAGFVEFDDPAEIILFEDEPVAYHYVVWGHIKDNDSINLFYPVLNDGTLMIGAIPVMVTPYDLDDIENSLTICYELYPDALLIIKSAELINGEFEKEDVPEETLEPDATPNATEAPVVTHAPTTQTPKPTPTPKPTNPSEPTPTPFVWKCMYCGKTFGSSDADYEAWYQHAWYNPGCYAAGHAVTPAPTPTPTPSHSAENGHWEEVWVVDVPMVCHTVWVCNVCHWETTDFYAMSGHQVDHINTIGLTGYHSYVVIDQPEVGHWETVWVPDP